MQQQRGGADCGVFAAAVCLAIASGADPAIIRWRQANMRIHLSQCIQDENFTPFPTVRKRGSKEVGSIIMEYLLIELWCVCRLPQYAYHNMVECP